jgi:lipopolysaccharide transport system permease protein/teichoic acid transport system permease protein
MIDSFNAARWWRRGLLAGPTQHPRLARLAQDIRLTRILALGQLRERYLGTFIGIVWAFIHPIVLIAIFWVVFAQGFKTPTSGNRPFLLLLICGLIPWMAYSEAVIGGAGAVLARAYLVRKIAFPLQILPISNVVAAFMLHIPLLLFALVILIVYGRPPRSTIAFLPLYMLGLFVVCIGMSLLLSAVCVVFRDVQQGLGIVINMLFWATPIVWPADILPANFAWMVRWNPLEYVIEGYRSALLPDVVAAPDLHLTLLFWCSTLACLGVGAWTFGRLKSGFADLV